MPYTDQEQPIDLMVDTQLGINNAIQPTALPKGGYLVKRNAYQNKIGSNAKRPGSTPVTSTALGSTIQYLTEYRFPNSVAAGVAPTLTAVAGSATLPADTYYVVYTYVTDNGETEASAEASQAILLTETLHIVIPAIPYHANSINIYISNATTTELLEVNTTSLTTDITAPLTGTGAAYPATNTTAFSTELLAASGTSLYSYYNGALNAATMTNALNKSDIYTVAFTDENLVSILFITDGAAVKKYDGTVVALITPAVDDPSPAPANGLAAINAKNPIYCWVFSGHLMVTDGTDVVYYSKQAIFDYFPVTYFNRWVRNNDYFTGPGIAFGNICLLPMRKGWGVLTGTDFSNFAGNLFLNTINGNIAPRAIAKITDSSGSQTVAYLSDDGYYEVYDTGFIDSSGSGTRNYATRSLMKNKVDFTSYGFTTAELTAAEAYFDSTLNLYISTIKRGAINYAFVYDVRTKEWDLWDNIRAESTIRFNDILYYAGSTKFLHKYDATLGIDYDDFAQTTGTDIDQDCYTDVLKFENTGFQSMFDYLIVNTKNFPTTSTWEITIVGTSDTSVLANAVQATYATWDVSLWDFCIIVNTDFTSIVGAPVRIPLKKKAYFVQIRFRNNKNELTELYSYRLIGRVSGG